MQKVGSGQVTFSVPLEYRSSDGGRASPGRLENDFPDDDQQSYGSDDIDPVFPPTLGVAEAKKTALQQLIADCFKDNEFNGDVDQAIALAKKSIDSSPLALAFLIQLKDAIDKKEIPASKVDLFDFLSLDQLFSAAELASKMEYNEVSHFLYKRVGIKDKDAGYTEKHALAFYRLAQQYEKGIGTKPAPALARGFCQKAIDLKYSPAIHRMGEYLESGIGGPKDLGQALNQYELAATAGEVQSLIRLARYYREEGEQSVENKKKAQDYLERAIKTGETIPLYEQGLVAYEKTESRENGFEMIKKAAQEGSYSAQLWLANFSSESSSLDPKPYFDASLKRNSIAIYRHLGMINYDGKSANQNLDLACAFFAKVVESPDCNTSDWQNFIKAKIAKEKDASTLALEEQISNFDGLIALYCLYKDGFKDDVQTIPVNWEKALQAFDRARSLDAAKKLDKKGLAATLTQQAQEIRKKLDELNSLHGKIESNLSILKTVENRLNDLMSLANFDDFLKENTIRGIKTESLSYIDQLDELKKHNKDIVEDIDPLYETRSKEIDLLFSTTIAEFCKRFDQRCEPIKQYLQRLQSLRKCPIPFHELKNQEGFEELTCKLASIMLIRSEQPKIEDITTIRNEATSKMKSRGQDILAEFKMQILHLRLAKGKIKQFEAKKTYISDLLQLNEPLLEEYQEQLNAVVKKIEAQLQSLVLDPHSANLDEEFESAMSAMDEIWKCFKVEKDALYSRKEKIQEMEAKKSAILERLRSKQAASALEIQGFQNGNAVCLEDMEREFASIAINRGSEDFDIELQQIAERLALFEQRFDSALNVFSLSAQQEEVKEAKAKKSGEMQELMTRLLASEKRAKEMETKLHQAERLAAQATERAARQIEELKRAHQSELEKQRKNGDALRDEVANLRMIVQSIPITTSIEILNNRIVQRINELKQKGITAYRDYNLNNFPPRVYNLEGLESILLGIGFKTSGDANGSHRHYERAAESMGLSPHGSEEANKAQIQQVLNFLLADLNKLT